MSSQEEIIEACKSSSTSLHIVEAAAKYAFEASVFRAERYLTPLNMNSSDWSNLHSELNEVKNAKHKILFFIRHGEGIHNVAEREYGTELWEANYALQDTFLDPGLTKVGIQQASDLRDAMLSLYDANHLIKPDMIVSSPLYRCVETASVVFPPKHAHFQDTPKLVVELFREQNGRHTCDKRKSLDSLQTTFPEWNLDRAYSKEDRITMNEDPSWSSERETIGDLNSRAHSFLEWVWEQDETNVYLSGHSGIIGACYSNLGNYRKLNNCELSAIVMVQK